MTRFALRASGGRRRETGGERQETGARFRAREKETRGERQGRLSARGDALRAVTSDELRAFARGRTEAGDRSAWGRGGVPFWGVLPRFVV